jgi:hypothetical protein
VASPTVLIGVDTLGHEVLDRVRHSLPEEEPSLRYLSGPVNEVGTQLAPMLDDLLRAGRVAADQRQVRLDLFAFVEVNALGEGELVSLCDQAARVVGERYGVMFATDLRARNAALHLVAVVPALAGGPEATRAIGRLRQLESWAENPPFPLLSRVWVLSRHTTAGTLTDEGLRASCAAFAVAAVGLRDEPQVSQRLAHLDDGEGRFGLLSVASLDVPEAGLRRYARERAAFDALATLVSRVTRQVSDSNAGDQAVAGLDLNQWFSGLEEGEAAQRARRLAASLSGAAPSLPEALPVGAFDDAEKVQETYPVLFRPGTVERAPTGQDSAELGETLRALDRVEADALAAVARGLDAVLTVTIGAQSGLRRVAEVELGLRRVAALLRDADAADRATLEQAPFGTRLSDGTISEEQRDPHRAELDQVLAELPSAWLQRGAGAAVGLGICALVVTLGLRLASPGGSGPTTPPPTAAPGVVTTGPTVAGKATSGAMAAPWGLGLVAGAAGGFGWASFAGIQSRERLRKLLRQRRDALDALWKTGGGGLARLQADAQIRLRKRRVRRAAMAGVEQTLLRLGALSSTLIDARDRSLQALRDMGVKSPASHAAQDDLHGLLGARDALHDVLVPPALLSAWVARRRQLTDPELWADRLVEQTWPARGIGEDVPCADHARIEALCRWQVAPFLEQSMLGDPEIAAAAAATVADFVRRAAAALAPACVPRDEYDNPAPGLRPGEAFVVAPRQGGPELEAALLRSPFAMPVLWAEARAARVLFLRSWEGLRVVDLARGARVTLS